MAKYSAFIAYLRHRLHIADHKLSHYIHHAAHCTYLGAAAAEAHGLYSMAAGVLLVTVVISAFTGGGVE